MIHETCSSACEDGRRPGGVPGLMNAETIRDSGFSSTFLIIPNSAWRLVSIYLEGINGLKQSAAEI